MNQDEKDFEQKEEVKEDVTSQTPDAEAAQAQESYSYGQPVEQEPVFDEPVHEAQNEAASAEAGRYCPNCGTRLEDDALFCAECGTKVG